MYPYKNSNIQQRKRSEETKRIEKKALSAGFLLMLAALIAEHFGVDWLAGILGLFALGFAMIYAYSSPNDHL